MSVITVQKSRFLGQPLTDEDAQSHLFVLEVGNLVAALDDCLNDSIAQFAVDFEIDSDDCIRQKSARQQLLRQFVSYLLQRPVADKELVRESLLDFEPVDDFFYNANTPTFSPSDETNRLLAEKNAELTAVRNENARLQREIQQLRREKLAAEEAATSTLRRRPTTRNRPSFASLDDYVNNMLHSAVADAVADALGKVSANV